jgi:hypothetical protein
MVMGKRFAGQRVDHPPAPFLSRKGVLKETENTGDTPVPPAEGGLRTPGGMGDQAWVMANRDCPGSIGGDRCS